MTMNKEAPRVKDHHHHYGLAFVYSNSFFACLDSSLFHPLTPPKKLPAKFKVEASWAREE
jgi:hypothetical protein